MEVLLYILAGAGLFIFWKKIKKEADYLDFKQKINR